MKKLRKVTEIRHDYRRSRAVDDAGQDIAPEVVGAEPMRPP